MYRLAWAGGPTCCRASFTKAFVERFTRRVVAHQEQRRVASAAKALERERAQAEKRVRNITQALAISGMSEALLHQLPDEEAKLRTLQEHQASRVAQDPRAQVLPHPKVVESFLADLLHLLEADPQKGNATLVRCIRPFILTPVGEGAERDYKATGAFNLAVLLKLETSPPFEGEVSANSSSGGAISDLSNTALPYPVRLPVSRRAA